jgi:hypothetical protein
MPSEDIAAARRALVTSGKLLEALAASPNQDEDVNLYAVQGFDRAAMLYVQQLGKERTTEAGPRYSTLQGARARSQATSSADEH